MKLSKQLFYMVFGAVLFSGGAIASQASKIIGNYANIALANYEDSLTTAIALQDTINQLLDVPTEANLAAAKVAWKAARVPYQQTEVFRFGNAIVDNWEGRVNAWPLDEGLIDYVASAYGTGSGENPFYSANVVANPYLHIGGVMVDASTISKSLLSKTLHEIDAVESNVATGYHAIEFLLWGQDLNGTNPGSGNRPVTDFNLDNCTNGHCDRRRDYLLAATNLLVDDLQEMVDNWKTDGAARSNLMAKGDVGGLSTIVTGMGSLAYGELAGDRIKLGLMLHDPEEEHDCFSDNTHWSHFYDAKGIKNIYMGSYTRTDGSVVGGASLAGLLQTNNGAIDRDMRAALESTEVAMQKMVDMAEAGAPFDVLIGEHNPAGNKVVQDIIDALVAESAVIERVALQLAAK
jgi:putative iron-regulated protein